MPSPPPPSSPPAVCSAIGRERAERESEADSKREKQSLREEKIFFLEFFFPFYFMNKQKKTIASLSTSLLKNVKRSNELHSLSLSVSLPPTSQFVSKKTPLSLTLFFLRRKKKNSTALLPPNEPVGGEDAAAEGARQQQAGGDSHVAEKVRSDVRGEVAVVA